MEVTMVLLGPKLITMGRTIVCFTGSVHFDGSLYRSASGVFIIGYLNTRYSKRATR